MGVAAPCNYEMFDCEALMEQRERRRGEGRCQPTRGCNIAASAHSLAAAAKDLHAESLAMTMNFPVNLTESLHLPAALDPATI